MEIRAVFWVDGVKKADVTVEATDWAGPYVVEQACHTLRNPDMAKVRLLAGVDEMPPAKPVGAKRRRA